MNIKIDEATNYIKTRYHGKIDVAIVLGSGLSPLADKIEGIAEIDYRDIPHFPLSNIPGHEGKIIIGSLGDKTVMALKGRFHLYEGYSMELITLPIRIFKRLGIDKLILTNACGAIRDDLQPGQIMLIKDHLSLFCPSPLSGPNLDEFGPRFKDMSAVYNPEVGKLAHLIADDNKITLQEGVYAFFPGPMYETPADIRAYRMLGCDAVGMSTVPEAIVANHCDMQILGLALVTNKAAGLSSQALDHEDVLATASKAQEDLSTLIIETLKKW